jgi:hypothetical protein
MQKKPKELIKIRYYIKQKVENRFNDPKYSEESDLFKGSYGTSERDQGSDSLHHEQVRQQIMDQNFNYQLLNRTSLLFILIGGVTALTIQFFFNKNTLTQIIKILAILFYTSGFLGFIISIQKKEGIEKNDKQK